MFQFENGEGDSSGIKILLNASQREEYLKFMLLSDGLDNVVEDPRAAYCPISLTFTPNELKPYLQQRQEILLDVLRSVGINAYDPDTAPFSPDRNRSTNPNDIYRIDSLRIAGARFCVGHDIIPSTGFGVEIEKARILNRIVINLRDKRHRVGRMQPSRVISLAYDNFLDQADEFKEVFKFLMDFELGMGMRGDIPILIGFDNKGDVYDLEEEVYKRFSNLKYEYDGNKDIIPLMVAPNNERCRKRYEEFAAFYGLTEGFGLETF